MSKFFRILLPNIISRKFKKKKFWLTKQFLSIGEKINPPGRLRETANHDALAKCKKDFALKNYGMYYKILKSLSHSFKNRKAAQKL